MPEIFLFFRSNKQRYNRPVVLNVVDFLILKKSLAVIVTGGFTLFRAILNNLLCCYLLASF